MKGISHYRNEHKSLHLYQQRLLNSDIIFQFFNINNIEEEYQDIYTTIKLLDRYAIDSLVYKNKYYHLWKNTHPEINGHILFNKNILLNAKVRYTLAYIRVLPMIKYLVKLLQRI